MEIQPGLFDGNIKAGNVFSLSSLKATIGLYQFHRRQRRFFFTLYFQHQIAADPSGQGLIIPKKSLQSRWFIPIDPAHMQLDFQFSPTINGHYPVR